MSDSRTRVWFALFVLVVFCVGLSAGLLLGRRMAGLPGVREFGGPPGFAGGRRGGPPPGVLLDRLDRELSLNQEQRTQIDVVLKAGRGRLDRFQQETRARFEGEQQSLHDEIRALLTPEQQRRFDRWIDATRPRGPGRRGRADRPPGALP